MHLLEMLNEQTINLDLQAGTKEEALDQLATMLKNNERLVDKETFLKDVFEREAIEPTDMGIGVAIPHGKSAAVKQTTVAIGRLTEPIYWNGTSDNSDEPIFAIFLLAVSLNDKGTTHLEIISKIASLLIDDQFIDSLRHTPNQSSLLETIEKYLGEM
jgi:PTS system fructose-specific IIA component